MSTVAEPFGGYDFGANVVRKRELGPVERLENRRHEGVRVGVQLTIEHAAKMIQVDRERRHMAAEAIVRHHIAARELFGVEAIVEHPIDRGPFEIDL